MHQLQSRIRSKLYTGYVKFFRFQLLSLDSDRVIKLVDRMEKECDQIREESIKFAWYMRGGLSYEDAMSLAPNERKIINNLIKDNLDTTKKSGLPFF